MEILELFLILVIAVLISALIDRRLPRITAPLVQIRFIWCAILVKISKQKWNDDGQELGFGKIVGLLTFGGAKGAITMSAILMIPTSFASRNALVFIASCIIIATLLLANFIMPKLVATDLNPTINFKSDEKRIDILRSVMARFPEAGREFDPAAVAKVAEEYQKRIVAASGSSKADPESRELRLRAIGWERERLAELSDGGDYKTRDLDRMSAYLDQKENYYEQKSDWKLNAALSWKHMRSSAMSWAETFAKSLGLMNSEQSDEKVRGYAGLRNECSLHAISKLQKLAVEEPQIAERISSLASDYRLDMLSTVPRKAV